MGKLMASEELERAAVDEYFRNGYNGMKAAVSIRPEISEKGASNWFNAIIKKPDVREYIEQKMAVMRAEAQIDAIHVLKELIQFSFSDITDYIGLTVEELKELPPEVRRCISQFKRKTRTFLPRGAEPGEEVTEDIIEIKLFDKVKTLEMINKHIGFYLEDNKQKGVKIDLSKASNVQLNMLLNLAEQSSE